MKSLEQCWYQSDVLAKIITGLLLPLSWLYCGLVFFRRKLYQFQIKKTVATDVPVVVIGNIVVGGSGKTPLLIAVCEFIKINGFRPGIVSRGYGGSVSGTKQVLESDSAKLVGDEPLMIHQRTKVPVVVGADRVAAIDYLLKNNRCDIVLSDDGLQHYNMQRDIEIAVIDASRGVGNGFCLPAGPLREPVSRLNEVDLVVFNGKKNSQIDGLKKASADACSYMLKVSHVTHLSKTKEVVLSFFLDKTVHAVAGIGHPPRFFSQLSDSGIVIVEHAFSDHHNYELADFSGWQNECIIMTEKDAVKCRHLSLPDAWVVSVDAEFSAALVSQLNSKILPLLN